MLNAARKFLFVTLAALVVAAVPAIGHAEAANPYHLVGQAVKIAGNTVTVAINVGTPDQVSADVLLQPDTTYKVGVKPATRGDLQQGDTVDVTVVRKNPNWLAVAVKITHPKPAKK
jgi:pentose-5-phosphate-3-epimerase